MPFLSVLVSTRVYLLFPVYCGFEWQSKHLRELKRQKADKALIETRTRELLKLKEELRRGVTRLSCTLPSTVPGLPPSNTLSGLDIGSRPSAPVKERGGPEQWKASKATRGAWPCCQEKSFVPTALPAEDDDVYVALLMNDAVLPAGKGVSPLLASLRAEIAAKVRLLCVGRPSALMPPPSAGRPSWVSSVTECPLLEPVCLDCLDGLGELPTNPWDRLSSWPQEWGARGGGEVKNLGWRVWVLWIMTGRRS